MVTGVLSWSDRTQPVSGNARGYPDEDNGGRSTGGTNVGSFHQSTARPGLAVRLAPSCYLLLCQAVA